MEALNHQTDEIVVYPNRKRLFWAYSVMVLAYLLIGGMDVFTLWAFWKHYEIDTAAYVAAVVLFLGTVFMGWATFLMLYRLRWRGPLIRIHAQGFTVAFPLRFTLLPRIKPSFLPWEEIEWISTFSSYRMYTWLTLGLKHPARYWSLYESGKYRIWRRDPLTGAHIGIVQCPLSLSAKQILQQIEERYRSELSRYEVQVRH